MPLSRPERSDESGLEQTENQLARALARDGLLIPETAAEIRRAEEILSEANVELPKYLIDADEVFERLGGPLQVGGAATPATSGEAQENLARAARDGGEVPRDVEQLMRQDREQAEKGTDGEEQ